MPTEPEPDVSAYVRVYEQLLGRSCAWCGRHAPYSGQIAWA
ncbi:hypothetical protein [Streptosporangium roseum]|uniref:Uncharacterized protein n=1 Tax=Streptosporangium roseum (strain ATCC 12428 / DSM 43021 / JCM 3005 / KCTC 9067 / NCIMB 10171 / NRRL 2505 / NI 9100) TaxID=479432 RepID=D2B088_STRRD|nr:hypothetical protein [Streptosporangium roseum]ACZ89094.1 hypothetical protein Sros_6376 [Streptosporangium roseum DSM 43021]